MTKFNNALGLDIGDARIGVARINSIAQIPEPLTTLLNDETFVTQLAGLIDEHSIDLIVYGIPRNMSGEETQQTAKTRLLVSKLQQEFCQIPFEGQDETLTSVDAVAVLKTGIKGDKDSAAAAYILQDYAGSHREEHYV